MPLFLQQRIFEAVGLVSGSGAGGLIQLLTLALGKAKLMSLTVALTGGLTAVTLLVPSDSPLAGEIEQSTPPTEIIVGQAAEPRSPDLSDVVGASNVSDDAPDNATPATATAAEPPGTNPTAPGPQEAISERPPEPPRAAAPVTVEGPAGTRVNVAGAISVPVATPQGSLPEVRVEVPAAESVHAALDGAGIGGSDPNTVAYPNALASPTAFADPTAVIPAPPVSATIAPVPDGSNPILPGTSGSGQATGSTSVGTGGAIQVSPPLPISGR